MLLDALKPDATVATSSRRVSGGPNRSTLFAITLNVETAVYAIDTQVKGYQPGEWRK